ncbi:4031_t:CDS:2 [Dentiscutata erythropus]|uniref:4031_t:CDS:1 n=1 Tax=Dentiscutata erythropus TaxID=1348616 RepID=A0A9N9ALV5_9GLOM|nr:4031_t:CDS:2 [Dentiscutata erythropus]
MDEVDKSPADSNKLANTESDNPIGLEWYLYVDRVVENKEEISQRREIVSGTNEDMNITNRANFW